MAPRWYGRWRRQRYPEMHSRDRRSSGAGNYLIVSVARLRPRFLFLWMCPERRISVMGGEQRAMVLSQFDCATMIDAKGGTWSIEQEN